MYLLLPQLVAKDQPGVADVVAAHFATAHAWDAVVRARVSSLAAAAAAQPLHSVALASVPALAACLATSCTQHANWAWSCMLPLHLPCADVPGAVWRQPNPQCRRRLPPLPGGVGQPGGQRPGPAQLPQLCSPGEAGAAASAGGARLVALPWPLHEQLQAAHSAHGWFDGTNDPFLRRWLKGLPRMARRPGGWRGRRARHSVPLWLSSAGQVSLATSWPWACRCAGDCWAVLSPGAT